jgi:type 2 lantibiotic biosynthesis protein LanM
MRSFAETPGLAATEALAEETWASAEWYEALTLSERSLRWRSGCATGPAAGDSDRDDRDGRAGRRFGRWRAQSPFPDEGVLRRRLAGEGLTPQDLRALLGEPPEELAARTAGRPGWLDELERAFSAARTDPFPLEDVLAGSGQGAMLELVRPLLDAGYARLAAGIRTLAAASPRPPYDAAAAARLMAGNIPSHLQLLLGRCMTVELHLASRSGCLAGDTPEARFQSFAASLRDPAVALPILRRYPVLARQVTETIGRWVDYSLEILAHLAADAARLRAVFASGRELGTLTEATAGLGDAHRGGRSVVRLRFDSNLALVYKPRCVAVEAAFQRLLEWTCERDFAPAFRLLRVLDAGDHGWAELVVAAPCADAGQLERFYLRQGGYLALLYALSATDMHHENLVAVGEHPVLVDLEALFHPQDQTLGRAAVGPALPDTALRVGFLPTADWGGLNDKDGIDLSGLTASAGQIMPAPVLQATDTGTDQMRFQRRRLAVPVGEHRPTLGGAEVPLGPHIASIVAGFDRMARLLRTHREELLSPSGPLAAFAAAPIRVLVRMTMAYATLFFDGQHPHVLGDALDRDRLFDRLWSAVDDYPALERLVPAEHRDLCRGDIPMFTTSPGSLDLWTSDGEVVPGFLETTALDVVRQRLAGLDEAELGRQTWIVRNSLGAVVGGRGESPFYDLRESAAAPPRDDLIAAAVDAGLRLEALAFRSGDAALWFAPDVRADGSRWSLVPAAPDLHMGIPGIALFLAYLGRVSGEQRFTRLARAAAVTLRHQIGPGENRLDAIGGFSGWGGVLYTFTHLGALWEDESLLDQAEQVAATLEPLIADDSNYDVVGGAAGCLVSLLGLGAWRAQERSLQLAVRCGERILERARRMDRGLGWVLEIAGPQPLAGFSHGAAGISWALLQLAAACGDSRYRRAALAGVEYERSLYSAAEANWPDLRGGGPTPDGGGLRYMCAWCHGAAGIALGRLDSLRFADHPELREDAAIALRTTLATGFGKGHCLCHGDLGNLEAISLAAEVLADPFFAQRAAALAGGILDGIKRHGRLVGVSTDAEAPGLMVGIAGIGYGLLRLAAPRQVPSVLRLAPPPIR